VSFFSAPQFDLSVQEPDAGVRTVVVTGEIHVSSAPEFSRRLNEAIGGDDSPIALDLSDVTFIDSTGLGVLLNGLRRVTREGRRMALACANPTVLRLFQVTRLDSTFEILPTREDAVEHLRAAPASGRRQAGGGESASGAP
jgi:anti-sigma B factor antagonist